MGVTFRVKGRWACFSRIEFKVETVTYDVLTPSAAKGILGSIYAKPEIDWVIDGIQVLNPIRTISYMRNYVTEAIRIKGMIKSEKVPTPVDVTSMRDQRNATILTNVDYVIQAHFNILSGDDNSAKHIEMFKRRASKGQCFKHPYLGIREFSADRWELLDSIPESVPFKGKEIDFGYMLHSIDYKSPSCPYALYRAVMKDGFIKVPPFSSPEVKK